MIGPGPKARTTPPCQPAPVPTLIGTATRPTPPFGVTATGPSRETSPLPMRRPRPKTAPQAKRPSSRPARPPPSAPRQHSRPRLRCPDRPKPSAPRRHSRPRLRCRTDRRRARRGGSRPRLWFRTDRRRARRSGTRGRAFGAGPTEAERAAAALAATPSVPDRPAPSAPRRHSRPRLWCRTDRRRARRSGTRGGAFEWRRPGPDTARSRSSALIAWPRASREAFGPSSSTRVQ